MRRITTTDIPVAPYCTVINILRGMAGAAAAPPTTPPPATFLTTAPAFVDRRPPADQFIAPVFLQYDPLAAGAFLTTSPPRADQIMPYRSVPVVFFPPQPPPPDPLQVRRVVPQPIVYQVPWRRESSAVITPPFTSFFFPTEVPRFFNPVPPWRPTPGYILDVSRILQPQIPDRPAPPPPTAGVRKSPPYMRRLKLLGLREDHGIALQ